MQGPCSTSEHGGQAPHAGEFSGVEAMPLASEVGVPKGQVDGRYATRAGNRHQVPGVVCSHRDRQNDQ